MGCRFLRSSFLTGISPGRRGVVPVRGARSLLGGHGGLATRTVIQLSARATFLSLNFCYVGGKWGRKLLSHWHSIWQFQFNAFSLNCKQPCRSLLSASQAPSLTENPFPADCRKRVFLLCYGILTVGFLHIIYKQICIFLGKS